MEKRKAVSSHAEAEANRRAYLDAYQALACLLVFCYHSALNPQARQDRLGRVQWCPLVFCPEWLFARRQVAGEAQCRRQAVDDFRLFEAPLSKNLVKFSWTFIRGDPVAEYRRLFGDLRTRFS
jgi:hypothetical protein